MDIEEKMIALFHSVNFLLADKSPQSVLFVSSRKGEGTTTLVKEFGKISATLFGKTVLLLENDRFQPVHNLTAAEQQENMNAIIGEHTEVERLFHQTGDSSFFRSPVSLYGTSLTNIFSLSTIDRFIEKLERRFDLILVDSPPVAETNDALSVVRHVDGIVLVVEAEATRYPVVESVKEKIEKVGGNILGVVLNKQRHYIPSFIYKHL